MIKLYGIPFSRTMRCLWLLEEMGLEYENIAIHFLEASKRADYLELNPNGKVPCLVDGDFVVFESLAINFYLMQKYPGPLRPATAAAEARALQWSFWGTFEIDAHLTRSLEIKGPQEQDPRARASVLAALEILDTVLGTREFLVGETFSIADLNVASMIGQTRVYGYDTSGFEHLSEWFDERCFSRDAARRVVEMMQASYREHEGSRPISVRFSAGGHDL